MPPMPASTSATPSPESSSGDRPGPGLVAGLVPLGWVVLIVIVALAVAALGRGLTAGQGFAVQQGTAVGVLVVGLLAAAAAYIVSGRRALRQVAQWQQVGMTARATGALLGLALGALVVLLPLLLAIFLPQHPAPNLAP
jgi:hypothetical protein